MPDKYDLDLTNSTRYRLIRFLLPATRLKRRFKKHALLKYLNKRLPHIYSYSETLKLLKEGYSLARIGDGEFSYIFDKNNKLYFQPHNEDLRNSLAKILKSGNSGKLLVGIMNPQTAANYILLFYVKFWEHISQIINFSAQYADSTITREYFLVKYANTKRSCIDEHKIDLLREIWQNRKVVFVFSSKGRFYIEPRLFDGISEARHIDIPPVDAFSEYDRILLEAKSYSTDYLFLIAAGPTATVLAYDLTQLGYQAIDIGHLPNCYQYVLKESVLPEHLPLSK